MEIKIKNQCCSCRKEFQNSEKRYNEKGNYCDSCCFKIDKMMTWRTLRHKQNRSFKQEAKFLELTDEILKKWGIVMEENDNKFQGFKKAMKALTI